MCLPSSEIIMKKKQEVASARVNLINTFIDDDDDDDKNSENGNFIFFLSMQSPLLSPLCI